MKRIFWIFLSLTAFAAAVFSQPQKIESLYTNLGEKYCKNTKDDFISRSECPGIAGYKLEVTDSAGRQDLNIIFPDGKKHELDFFTYASTESSAFGEKAEWRVSREGRKVKPTGLIVRFDAFESPESQKVKSYLVVVRIANDSACVTDIVEPSVKNQNISARNLGGNAAEKPCLATAQIPNLIDRLAGKDEFQANSASDALKKIGPAVIAPLIERMKQTNFCDFHYMAAEVIRKLDKNNAILKPTYFGIARGKCGYRYSPDKYLPDANFGSIIAQFDAARLLVSEIEGGIYLLPELKDDEGIGLISSLYAFMYVIPTISKQNKADVKPEVISALKATIPMLEKSAEMYDGKTRCDFYEVLQWMQESGFEELRVEANRALEGKTVSCPK